jgi:multidrug efflux pump subunit AcrB
MAAGTLPSGFIPEEDVDRTLFVVELPPGSRLDDTKAVTDRVAAQMRTLPEVRSVFVDGGRQLPGKKEVRLATLTVNSRRRRARAPPGAGRERDRRDAARGPDIRSWA